MEDQNNSSTIKNLVDTAKSVIVILPPDPGKDLVVAATSLHLAFKESGKTSQIGCGSEVHVDPQIAGVSEIADTIGSRNLVISFDYQEDDLEKVDYDVRDDGKFYLLVKPKAGAPVPDVHTVKYSYSGATADLVITLGINSLEELGKIYADEKKFLDSSPIISFNNSLRPVAFTSHVYHKALNSFSELVTVFFEEFNLSVNPAISQNLLANIYESTANLTTGRLTTDTFSAIAFLMRSGAQLPVKQSVRTPHFSQPPFFEPPETTETPPLAPVDDAIPLPEEENLPAEQTAPVPSDWSKPKIFRVNGKTD
jgi:hypothetical protein